MSNYIDLLKKSLLDDIYGNQKRINGLGQATTQKVTRDDIEEGRYWPERAHTMVGYKRLNNVQDCIENILNDNVEGDLIETGVWRGGVTILMKGILNHYGDMIRKVFVADSFEGLPQPDPERYPADYGDRHYKIPMLAVSLSEVKNNFAAYDLLDDRVIFVKGFFEHSLKNPPVPIEKLALLRLDGDMYSSTIQVLEQLYDKVSPGGYIIVDDYALNGCRKAIDDFRAQRGITDPIFKVDHTGVFWRKS